MRFLLLGLLAFSAPSLLHAQTVVQDTTVYERARVTQTFDLGTTTVPETGLAGHAQELSAVILDGPDAGETITFKNEYIQLAPDDVFFARHITNPLDGIDAWSVADPIRLPIIEGLAALFLLLVVVFGGLPGVRGLITLAGSIALIFYALIPGLYAGIPAAPVALGVAGVIIVLGSYITHGFNRTTSTAVLGMLGTLAITGLIGYLVIHLAQLSGFTTEETVYLDLSVRGRIDMLGLLFGGILIGLLGVLYDIAIGQAVAVEELHAAAPDMPRRTLYLRALRIGREHIGALVNTLAIAYVGASLPLLLLLQSGANNSTTVPYLLTGELFASEIIRILVGSIGLVLAVPITTAIAAALLHGRTTRAVHTHAH